MFSARCYSGLLCATVILLFPQEAHLSGEAGAAYLSKYYQFTYSSGMIISIDPLEPGDEKEYYDEEEKAYAKEIAPFVSSISQVVDEFRDKKLLDLRPITEPHLFIDKEVSILQTKEDRPKGTAPLRSWLTAHAPMGLTMYVDGKAKDGKHFSMMLSSNGPPLKSSLDALAKKIEELLLASAAPKGSADSLVPAFVAQEKGERFWLEFNCGDIYWERTFEKELVEASKKKAKEYFNLIQKELNRSFKSPVGDKEKIREGMNKKDLAYTSLSENQDRIDLYFNLSGEQRYDKVEKIRLHFFHFFQKRNEQLYVSIPDKIFD